VHLFLQRSTQRSSASNQRHLEHGGLRSRDGLFKRPRREEADDAIRDFTFRRGWRSEHGCADGSTGARNVPEGTYELRATNERPMPAVGQSPDAERWVEFVADGSVVAREVAVVLRDDDRPAIGASSVASRSGTQVEMLKGGEFLRISVKRGGEQYLLYLPITR
jgi:hypothetical protein